MPQTLNITQPDDWHLHVRRGGWLQTVVAHSAARFARAMIMPNLQPPICRVVEALRYRAEICAACPAEVDFEPIMSLYLTEHSEVEEVTRAAASPHIGGFKLYPAGATTHSEHAVTDVAKIMPVLEAMAEHGVVLQIHGEVTDSQVDVFAREAVFIERVLQPLCEALPQLKIVLEHITTSEAVQFIQTGRAGVAATITPQHLLFNRNAIFHGGIRPHYYCLPLLKHETHRRALVAAATSGNPRFFLGSDSAPHTQADKQSACGCAGCYTAFAGIELYAEVFEAAQALDKLEGFASHYGADFYGYRRNRGRLTLVKREWSVPERYALPSVGTQEACVIPLRAGETLRWAIEGEL